MLDLTRVTGSPSALQVYSRLYLAANLRRWLGVALTTAGSTGKMGNRGHKSVDFLSSG